MAHAPGDKEPAETTLSRPTKESFLVCLVWKTAVGQTPEDILRNLHGQRINANHVLISKDGKAWFTQTGSRSARKTMVQRIRAAARAVLSAERVQFSEAETLQ